MKEVSIVESAFTAQPEVHERLAEQLDFPSYYGANLDALADCLGDVCEETGIVVHLDVSYEAADAADGESPDAPVNPLYAWFPRLCRTLLRASGANPCLDVVVNIENLQGFQRILGCPGLPDLLENGQFAVHGTVARLSQETR